MERYHIYDSNLNVSFDTDKENFEKYFDLDNYYASDKHYGITTLYYENDNVFGTVQFD